MESQTDTSKTVVFYCPGIQPFEVIAEAVCADGNGTYHQLPIEFTNPQPHVSITEIQRVAAGQYQVSQIFGLSGGQRESYRSWNVYARLSENVYAEEPVRYSTSTINGAPGDKVEVYVIVCGTGASASDIAFIPPPPAVSVVVMDGDGQRAVALEAAEKPLKVKVTSADPSITVGASFEVISFPPGAKGYSVSGSGVAADGTATAVIVVGDKAGPYVVRVTGSGPGATSSEVTFTTTAVIPSKIGIVKDTTELADLAPAYAVSSSDGTTFYSIGLDEAGQKIGPMKCTWFTSGKGKPATKGQGIILSPVEGVPSCRFEPTKPGKLNLNARSALKGVSDGVADLFVTSLYVSMGNFDPETPVDDLGIFVPGTKADGGSLDPTAMPQQLTLHVLTGSGSKGSVTFALEDVSAYPGIAMNYPIDNPTTTPDLALRDLGGNRVQTVTIPFSSTGDTSVVALVMDYAAHGNLKTTISSGKATYQLQNIALPVDANSNGIADRGWDALANSESGATNHVPDVYSPNADGDNDPIGSGLPSLGLAGDGLSTAEEYRGFVVRGGHRRLHPLRKDLFLVIDPQDDAWDDRVSELTLTIHEIRRTEAVGDFGPVVNPNRAAVPGASLQRALWARNRAVPPLYHRVDGAVVRADFEVQGWTFQQGNDVNLIDGTLASLDLVQSPNETLVAEIYDWSFWRHYISYGPNAIRDTHVAATDTDYPENRAIFGEDDWVQSMPNSADPFGDDFQTTAIRTVCGGAPDSPWRAITLDELLDKYRTTFLHEVAHGIDVEHDRVDCSPSIMSDEGAVPVHRSLTPTDLSQIRIHRKQQ